MEARCNGTFPLVSNDRVMTEQELLLAYKQQPAIERRFDQLKTDFVVAPVYFKAVRRIQALFCMYFFVLLVEALLERQLRQAMQQEEIEIVAIVSRRTCLPLADSTAGDRPVRVRAAPFPAVRQATSRSL